jgi:hypothetical protein
MTNKVSEFCGNCKQKYKAGTLLTCSQCLSEYYCCKECQTKAWPTHKVICKQIVAKPAADAILRHEINLSHACDKGSLTGIQVAIANGAVINKRYWEQYQTPLMFTCIRGHEACADYLLQRKADPNIADKKARPH